MRPPLSPPLLAALLSVGCADRDWRAAVDAHTAAAYSTYARVHPGTGRAATAARRAEALAWEEAVRANTSRAFEGFRSAYPASTLAADAAARAEDRGWAEAEATADVAGYAQFLARYPRSPRAPEAGSRIEALVWAGATGDDTEASYGRYLLRYPDGPHAAEAAARREELAWIAATLADTPAAYRSFLDAHEGGAHTDAARAWLDAVRVSRLRPVVVLARTWRPAEERPAILGRYREAVESWLAEGLGRDFGTEPLALVDAEATPWGHPQDRFAPAPDTGLLVIEVVEKRGQAFEPTGHATAVEARLRLYAPHTRTPVVERSVSGATPARVEGVDESALHAGAVAAAVGALRVIEAEVLRLRRPE